MLGDPLFFPLDGQTKGGVVVGTTPAKLVKGQGLCKLTVEAQDPQMEQQEGWEKKVDMLQNEVVYMSTLTNSWYNDMKYYLTHGRNPNHLDARKK